MWHFEHTRNNNTLRQQQNNFLLFAGVSFCSSWWCNYWWFGNFEIVVNTIKWDEKLKYEYLKKERKKKISGAKPNPEWVQRKLSEKKTIQSSTMNSNTK